MPAFWLEFGSHQLATALVGPYQSNIETRLLEKYYEGEWGSFAANKSPDDRRYACTT